MDKDILTEIESVFHDTDFEGTCDTGFTRSVEQVVSTAVINGNPVEKRTTVKFRVEYRGEGAIITNDISKPTRGFKIYVNDDDGGDIWIEDDDVVAELKKIFTGWGI